MTRNWKGSNQISFGKITILVIQKKGFEVERGYIQENQFESSCCAPEKKSC
jgi:hypothetical protein